MNRHDNRKKKLIISHENLSEELRELFKEAYPEGHKDRMQKIIKPDGTPIFVVPLETDDTSYMVKFEVRIDSHFADDDLDKDLDDIKEDNDRFEPLPDESSEKDNEHKEYKLNHGAYEDSYDIKLDDVFDVEDDVNDDYIDEDMDDDDEEDTDEENYINDYDDEPNDADILDIEENYLMNDPTLLKSKQEKNVDTKGVKTSKVAKEKKEPKARKTTTTKTAKATKTKEPKTAKEKVAKPKKETTKKTKTTKKTS